MNRQRRTWNVIIAVICLVGLIGFNATAAAVAPGFVWLGPAGGGGWNGFMQTILQQDYRLQMTNGNPYWNALMVPVADTAVTSGMSSQMGLPAFGFCPVPGQCYMVLVQRPLPYSSMTTYIPPAQPAVPGPIVPNQSGKPTSLW